MSGDLVTDSPSARRLADCLAVADTAGVVVALAVIVASAARGRGTGGIGLLVVPGSLLLAAGQLWAMAVIQARQPPRAGRRFLGGIGGTGSIGQDLRSYFGPLDRRITSIIVALCVIGFLSFITSIFFTWDGGPAGSGGGCAYRLESHGNYTCVSRTAYNLAGGAQQRIGAGIFLLFYACHLYAALASGQAARRRSGGAGQRV